MWVVVSGDGDVDYLQVFGPFATEAEAEAELLEDDDDISWRVHKVESPSAIFEG